MSPSKNSSFFLFGARGVGKSTFLKKQFKMKNPWVLDLLDPVVEDLYAKQPKRLEQELQSMKKKPDWIVIDEIQKVPRLLDMVHKLIEDNGQKFILTGSSARKLKRGMANMLAGRAFSYEMYPLSMLELENNFDLQDYLCWGGLPKVQSYKTSADKIKFLSGYILNYLNEEIRSEQIIRKLDPFRAFLPIVGQVSGKKINHSKIAKEVGVDTKTVQTYFQILEDTLLGFYLPAFHLSVRKAQSKALKFYLFDVGVQRSLEDTLEMTPKKHTSYYGDLFESFMVMEILKENRYSEKNFRMSYFEAKGGAEVDLVLSKGKQNILIEIKSNNQIDDTEILSLSRLAKDFPNLKAVYYLSQDSGSYKVDNVLCMNYKKFLMEFKKL